MDSREGIDWCSLGRRRMEGGKWTWTEEEQKKDGKRTFPFMDIGCHPIFLLQGTSLVGRAGTYLGQVRTFSTATIACHTSLFLLLHLPHSTIYAPVARYSPVRRFLCGQRCATPYCVGSLPSMIGFHQQPLHFSLARLGRPMAQRRWPQVKRGRSNRSRRYTNGPVLPSRFARNTCSIWPGQSFPEPIAIALVEKSNQRFSDVLNTMHSIQHQPLSTLTPVIQGH